MSRVTVTDLILNFASACRALIPALDYAEVPILDHLQYDNWDRISEPLFESLVLEPCVFAAVGEAKARQLRVFRYGYADHSDRDTYISYDEDGRSHTRFISLCTKTSPFDEFSFLDRGAIRQTALAGACFSFVFSLPSCGIQQLRDVDLNA